MRNLIIFIVGVAVMATGSPSFATNGHQLIGIGAYQKSMGGAVTAAPHTTAAAVSNPAGLALIGEKADFSFEGFMPKREVNFEKAFGESNEGGSPLYLIPAVGWVGETSSDDLFFGGGMYLMSGMGVDYDTINAAPFGAPQGDFTPWKANLYSQYQFWKLAPALAKKVNDNLSVGASLNIDYQQMAVKQKYFHPTSGQYMGADLSRASGALGFGVTVGALYKVSDMITFGATYISEQSFADMEYRLSQGDIMYPGATGMLMSQDGSYNMAMNFPQQFAFGVAITPVEGLKVTIDYKWINFSSTHDSVKLSGDFVVINPATGAPAGTATSMALPFGWDDVSVIAVGVEYVVSPMVTLRAGYNHGDSPISEEDVFNNAALPAITQDHLGLGAEFQLGTWGLGLSYMKAFKKELTGKADAQGQDSGAKISLEESAFLLSISRSFGS